MEKLKKDEIRKITSPPIKKDSQWKIFWKNLKTAFKKEIPLLQGSSTTKLTKWAILITILSAILLPFLGAYFIIQLIEPFFDIFKKDFGSLAIGMFFGVFVTCLVFFGLIAFSKILISAIFNQKQNWKPFFIFSLTITLFLCGFVFIHAIMGAPNNEWRLFNEKDYVTDILCEDAWGKLIEKHKIICYIQNPEIQGIDWNIMVNLGNGTRIDYNSSSFFAPTDISHIGMIINATNNKRQIKLTTGFFPKFYSEEEDLQRQKDFLTYFFGLLFICLITIPQLVLKMFEGIKK